MTSRENKPEGFWRSFSKGYSETFEALRPWIPTAVLLAMFVGLLIVIVAR